MKNLTVEKQTLDAYSDCNSDEPFEVTSKTRSLNFHASEFVPRTEAQRILALAIPQGYNAFKADLLNKFPKSAEIKIAREYSVALYVKPNCLLPSEEEVCADEKHMQDGLIRYWWD